MSNTIGFLIGLIGIKSSCACWIIGASWLGWKLTQFAVKVFECGGLLSDGQLGVSDSFIGSFLELLQSSFFELVILLLLSGGTNQEGADVEGSLGNEVVIGGNLLLVVEVIKSIELSFDILAVFNGDGVCNGLLSSFVGNGPASLDIFEGGEGLLLLIE